MKTQIRYPFVFALFSFWFGVLLSISFLETPIKFFVPGMTLPVALELGKIMFGISTWIQFAILFLIVLNFILSKKECTKMMVIVIVILAFILFLEKFWMLPILDARADLLASGKAVPPTTLHDYFIYTESTKLALVLVGIITQIKKNKL